MINVCYCGNAGIYDGLLLSALSLAKRTKESVHFFLLTADLRDKNPKFAPLNEKQRTFLEQVVRESNPEDQVTLIDCTALFLREMGQSVNLRSMYTPYTFLRLLLDKLALGLDRILYIDADTVIIKDLGELYHHDMAGRDVAAMHDYMNNLFFRHDYLNAGVLLLDLKQIGADHSFDQVRSLVNRKKMMMPDQDAVNIVYHHKKCFMDRKYNEQRKLRPDTVIRHYCQKIVLFPIIYVKKAKPWDGEKFKKAYPKERDDALLAEFLVKKTAFHAL